MYHIVRLRILWSIFGKRRHLLKGIVWQLIYSLHLVWGILCYLENPLVLKETELEKNNAMHLQCTKPDNPVADVYKMYRHDIRKHKIIKIYEEIFSLALSLLQLRIFSFLRTLTKWTPSEYHIPQVTFTKKKKKRVLLEHFSCYSHFCLLNTSREIQSFSLKHMYFFFMLDIAWPSYKY